MGDPVHCGWTLDSAYILYDEANVVLFRKVNGGTDLLRIGNIDNVLRITTECTRCRCVQTGKASASLKVWVQDIGWVRCPALISYEDATVHEDSLFFAGIPQAEVRKALVERQALCGIVVGPGGMTHREARVDVEKSPAKSIVQMFPRGPVFVPGK